MESAELIRRLREETTRLGNEVEKLEDQYNAMKIYAETLSNLNHSYWKTIVKLRKKVGDLGGRVEKDE